MGRGDQIQAQAKNTSNFWSFDLNDRKPQSNRMPKRCIFLKWLLDPSPLQQGTNAERARGERERESEERKKEGRKEKEERKKERKEGKKRRDARGGGGSRGEALADDAHVFAGDALAYRCELAITSDRKHRSACDRHAYEQGTSYNVRGVTCRYELRDR